MNPRPDIAEGKGCGECGLCCKLIGVESIAKPQFVWCKAYRKGVGCKVYDHRPSDCRSFICYWMHTPNLGPEWRPDRCGFVMHIADGGTRLNIEVDPGGPQAWTREPFLSAFRDWSAQGRERGLVLLVWVGRRCFEMTPEGAIDRGMIRPTTAERRGQRA